MLDPEAIEQFADQYSGIGDVNDPAEAKKILRPVLAGLGKDRAQALRAGLRAKAQRGDRRYVDLHVLVNEMAPAHR